MTLDALDCLAYLNNLHDTPQVFITLIRVHNVLIGLLNITGNAILIWGLCRTGQTKTISFHFIVIMSISDLTIGTSSLIFITMLLTESYEAYCWTKLAIQFLFTTLHYFSSFMVILVALDRYLHMRYLERYSIMLT